jgi:hypothetical protein
MGKVSLCLRKAAQVGKKKKTGETDPNECHSKYWQKGANFTLLLLNPAM